MNQSVRRFESLPRHLDVFESFDDPMLAGHNCRMQIVVFLARKFGQTARKPDFVDDIKRQPGDRC